MVFENLFMFLYVTFFSRTSEANFHASTVHDEERTKEVTSSQPSGSVERGAGKNTSGS